MIGTTAIYVEEEKSMSGRPKRAEILQKYGHAGEHLPGTLLEALDHDEEWWHNIEIDFHRDRHNLWWSRLSYKKRAEWLLGQLWNCTDIVPSLTRSQVRNWFPDDPEPLTFARVARLLKRDLDSQIEPNPDDQQEDQEDRKQLERKEQRLLDRDEARFQRAWERPCGKWRLAVTRNYDLSKSIQFSSANDLTAEADAKALRNFAFAFSPFEDGTQIEILGDLAIPPVEPEEE